MRLYDIASVIRSKNAGPFTLTLDIIFDTEEDYERVLKSAGFAAASIAEAYGKKTSEVAIHPFKAIKGVKITMPRAISSGAPGDSDVYGSQQHMPLANMEIEK
ncbi:MAG: DUF4387 domain-containing protein [Victivallales bacterium]|nr:DUF4387 domain-containing protein [Victivallales bacterium]